jgi:hypothetical protein
MFKDLEAGLEGVQEQQDRLGGQYNLDSGVYDGTLKLAYITDSTRSKSKCLVSVIDIDGFELTTRTWYLNGEGQPTYEKNGKKNMLPGYELVNDMHLVTTGQPITEAEVQDKTIKVWDADAQGEIEKNMPVVTTMLNKPITVAVLKVIENKSVKNESTGKYDPTNEKRTVNEIDKVFHTESRKTVVELMKKVDLPVEQLFITKWGEKNTGNDRDKFKPVGGPGAAPSSGTGSPAGGGSGAAKSLFAS